jgi:hypothetical protein
MMRKLLGLGMAAAMLVVASSAMAAGINLAWSNCLGEGTGTNNRTFACTSNAGTNILVTSFVLAEDAPQVSGNELVLDILTTSNPIPAWWQIRSPEICRPTALSINFVANANDVVCVDWAAGASAGGIGAYSNEIGSIDGSLLNQHRRIKIAIAVPLPLPDLIANTEYFACNLTINNTKTAGTGACAGCLEPVCIVFNSLLVTRPVGVGDILLSSGTSQGSNIVTWQGVGPNCALVPTRNVTWGSVKSLYR